MDRVKISKPWFSARLTVSCHQQQYDQGQEKLGDLLAAEGD
jgi:hypothetical protein